jgi:acetyl esterase/lipase
MGLAQPGLVALAALIMTLATASAEDSAMPDDLAWKLQELGRVIDPPKTAALYASLQETEPYRGIKVEHDVKYGPAERNLLDVFGPETGTSARPVLIFVHGGGFVAGNKRGSNGSPFYDNIEVDPLRGTRDRRS